MKVYKVNDCEWYMAETLEQAVELCMADCELPRDEACDGEHEESPERMERLKFRDDDDNVRTFAEELKLRLQRGDAPGMFASTEY